MSDDAVHGELPTTGLAPDSSASERAASAGDPAVSAPGGTATAGPSPAFSEILQRLAECRDLTRSEAAWALEQIIEGTTSDAETAAFLMALRVKGETAEEIAGLLGTMRGLAVPVETPQRDALVDIVGTGGDRLGTFNISTTAALVVAGAGVKVAKHGNRAASSRCGSADVLEALGVRIDLTPAQVAICLDRVGIGFMMASLHHPATAKVAGVRRALGVRTVFNLLGPLTNPAGVQRQLLGVSTAEHLEVLAGVLARVGCRHALLVRGDEGMDELSISGPSTVVEVERGVVQPPYSLQPEDQGLPRWAMGGLAGGEPADNAFITRGILSGSKGAARDVVLLNAGAALYVAGSVESIREGVDRAAVSIDSGRAAHVLEDLVALTSQLAEGRS
jgi:anthranilate phosphoribosyltransferase